MDLGKKIGSIKEKEKRVLYIILSFIIPFVVLVLGLIALHVAPFGEHSLAISDGKGYVYSLVGHGRFLTSLFEGKADFLYSLSGLGVNSWASDAWGNYNPVKLLALFITMENAPEMLSWISVVSFSFCGITMYILFAYLRGHKFSNLIFSTSYALIGFNVVNCFSVLFFIGPQLLPLMVLGLIKLMRGESPLTYILSFGLCTFFNFYFGFHLAVASLVFVLSYLYVKSNDLQGLKSKRFGTWICSSFIGGLLPAFFWLPALKAFSGDGGRLAQTGISEFTFKENMPFIQIFSKLFSGANSTDEMVNGLPNIFCGILVVALVILFFMNKKIEIRKKRAAGIIIGFYLLTFYITAFTLAMHGGTHTNWFPFRYSYVFSFILIYIAMEEFEYLDEITLKDTKKTGLILLIATAIVFSTSYGFVSGGSVVLDLLLLLAMWFGFYMYKTKPEKASRRILSFFLIIFVCGNLYANYVLSIYKVRDWELDTKAYQENVLKNGALIDAVKTYDTDFYRLEKEKQDLGNLAADSALYGYYGVSGSGPTVRAFVHAESSKIGINWWNMRHWYSEGVPAATDALLGIKYILSERDLTEEKEYERKVDLNGMSLYQNPNALPISILSNTEVGTLELGDDLFENLNVIWQSMTGEKEKVFNEQGNVTFTLKNNSNIQSITSKELQESIANAEAGKESEYDDNCIMEYTFTAEHDGPLYVFDTSIPSSGDGLQEPAIRYIGYYHKGDNVVGNFPIYNGYGTSDILRGYCANQVFAYADNRVLEKYAQKLSNRVITFNREKDSHLYGTFTAEKKHRIFFTIPWDEGWTCFIDGQKVPIDKTWNLFMSVEVPEGHHTWEMRFFPAWMNYGIYISIAALAGLVILMIVWSRNKKKYAAVGATSEKNVEGIIAEETAPVVGEIKSTEDMADSEKGSKEDKETEAEP